MAGLPQAAICSLYFTLFYYTATDAAAVNILLLPLINQSIKINKSVNQKIVGYNNDNNDMTMTTTTTMIMMIKSM